jgi:predicted DNA-binding ribbon-helix-helix protein
MSVSKLVSEIDANRQGNLSSAARLFVLNHFMVRRAGPAGNAKSG